VIGVNYLIFVSYQTYYCHQMCQNIISTRNHTTRMAWKNNNTCMPPILTSCHCCQNCFTKAHYSFQSTGTTNIGTVNSLNGIRFYVEKKKERGAGESKRMWAIEMNENHQIYLTSYGRIDSLDARIKQCKIFYCTWKYWHAAKNHAM
jgi:hypothetical protein